MKYSVLFVLLVSAVWAQGEPPVGVTVNSGSKSPSRLESEDVVLPAPASAVEVRQERSDEPAQFDLFADRAEFSLNGRRMTIPFGAERFAVYGGFVDYTVVDGALRFRYYDVTTPTTFAVQGKRFGLDTGGALTAVRQDADWVYSSVKGMSDGQLTATVIVRPLVRETVPEKPVVAAEPPKTEVPAAPAAVPVAAPEQTKVLPPVGASEPAPYYASPEERVAAELKNLPREDLVFRSAGISQVFAYLARKSGISFVSTNLDGSAKDTAGNSSQPTVTSRGFENPFSLLQIVAAEAGYMVEMVPNSISGDHSRGVWTLRSLDREGLIARTYRVRYNNLEKITGSSGGGGFSSSSSGGSGGSSSSSGNSMSSGVSPGSNFIFESDATRLKEEVEKILELTERGLVVPGDTDFTKSDTELNKELDVLGVPKVRGSSGTPAQGAAKARVLFSESTNTMFVIASRQQHEWVRGYLRSIDRPQRNILLEVKLVETSKSPSENYGIKIPKEISVDVVSRPQLEANILANADAESGSSSGYTYDSESFVFATSKSAVLPGAFPLTGIISADQMKFALSALKENSEGSNISYFYTAVTENREVVLKNTIQTPILAASSQVSTGVSGSGSGSGGSASGSLGGGTSSQQVQYRDIGMILNIRPSISGEDIVQMELGLELSSIAGSVSILGVSYPQPAVRAYKGPVRIRSGDSLAIGGLDEVYDQMTRSGLPLLGDIPVVGKLFSHQSKTKQRRHLLIFVTPKIQNGYSSGVENLERGVSLGDWKPYASGTVTNLAQLRRVCSGLVSYVNQLEMSFADGTLNRAHLGDVNGLFADIAAILQDYDSLKRIKAPTEEDVVFFQQVQSQRSRVERLRAQLMRVSEQARRG